MPTYYARASGNVNGANVWATTPSGAALATAPTFTSADVLCANGFGPITINVSVTVASIRNDAFVDGANTATAGGNFALANGVTLTGNVISGGATTCLTTSISTSSSIVGSITAGTTAAGVTISAGNLSVTGTVTGGTGANGSGITATGSSSVSITGDVVGGTGANAAGLTCNTTGNVTVTGNATAGSGGQGVNVVAGSSPITVTGSATGAGAVGVAISSGATVTVTVQRARGGALAGSSVGVANSASTTATVTVTEVEWGDAGASPTSGPIRFANTTATIAIGFVSTGVKKTLVDATSTGFLPAAANVRAGVGYGAVSAPFPRTGTLAVPSPSLVAAGEPTDATVGTAAITPAAMQAAVDAALAAFSSGRLSNVATVASTGQQIADAAP